MSIKTINHESITWTNIDDVNKEALDFLKTTHNFHHLDIEDIQEENQTPKIDIYKNYLLIILQFPYWNEQTKKVTAHQISFFIGNGFLITIEKDKTTPLNRLFGQCSKKRTIQREWMNAGPGYLLYLVIESLFLESRTIVKTINHHVAEVEDEIFEGNHPDSGLVYTLAKQRRDVLAFRRIIDPQRYLMGNLSHIRKPFLDETMSIYFDDVQDYLTKLWSIVTSFKDTIDGLHVTVESLLTRRTNKVISALTVISVSLLPLNLLTGIYGMNINLPFNKTPIIVWGMFGGLLGIILFTILMMKQRKWL